MLQQLPELIDPLRLVDEGQTLRGQIPLSRMQRLAPLLSTTQGVIDVELEFGRDERNLPSLHGRINAQLELICQRCLQPMPLAVYVQPALGLVTSRSEADYLPESYEPLLVGPEPLSLTVIVEDELVLGLPIVPKHENEHCATWLESGVSEQDAPREHPFAVLSRLKSNSHS